MSVLTQEAVSGIDAILESAQRDGRSSLYEHEVYGILSCLGLSVPRFHFVRDPREVSEAGLREIGPTLVAKIVSPDVPHKQKLGGVRVVSATDPLYVQYVLSRMRDEVESHFASDQRPAIAGFLLVEHVPHTQAIGYEVLIGFREDPAFGPALTVSKGGDDAEFFAQNYDPANIFLPPMEYDDALALMRSLHIRRKFDQIGHPEYLEMMARAMAQFSALSLAYSPMADRPRLVFKALEVNPFAISTRRAVRGPRRAGRVRRCSRGGGVEPEGRHRQPGRVLPPDRAWRWSASPRTLPSTAWRATSPSCCTSCGATTCTS